MKDLVQIEPTRLIRVFPYRTAFTPNDDLAFVGYPPFPGIRPAEDLPVHVSVLFRWWRPEAERIAASWRDHYSTVRIGGPAYGDLGDQFTPGRYLKLGCTITSRGCTQHCGWCPERTRPLVELPIKPGWIVQDSNLLACSAKHIVAVFEMLREQKRAIAFRGGLDKHFLQPWHRELFDSVPLAELWFACDVTKDLPAMEKAAKILEGVPLRKRRCYCMLGWDDRETLDTANARCQRILELGFMPFAPLYRPDDGPKQYSDDWRRLSRKWSRPAAYMGKAA